VRLTVFAGFPKQKSLQEEEMICNRRNKKNILCCVCFHGSEHKQRKDFEWVITGRDRNKECQEFGLCRDRGYIRVRCINRKGNNNETADTRDT